MDFKHHGLSGSKDELINITVNRLMLMNSVDNIVIFKGSDFGLPLICIL